MTVYIGQASIDENGRAHGGAAGDQTGREVYIRTWYNGNWSVLLRPRSKLVARKMVKFVSDVCNGDMVGYDQWQRNTLRGVARAAGWDGSKIRTKCETDCSAFVSVAAEAAGVDMSRAYTDLGNGVLNAPVTQTMRKAFCETGAFVALTDKAYLTSIDYLEAGDVLVRESGHTCLVITDGPRAINPTFSGDVQQDDELTPTVYPESRLYEVVTDVDPLNVRHEPGSAGAIIGTFARSEVVTGDSEVTVGTTKWIHCTDGSVTGWACGNYLKQVEDVAAPRAEEREDDTKMTTASFITMLSPEQAAEIIKLALSTPETKAAVTAALLESLSDKQAAVLMSMAQDWMAKLPESEWIIATGELEEAFTLGVTDSSRPRAFATREEAATMALRAYKLGKGKA